MNEHTSESRQVARARELYGQNFLCSQAVLAAFSEQLGLSEDQALKLGACFGGGMCKGEVCGACTGALMVLGLKFGKTEPMPENRQMSNRATERFLDLFREENGSYICRELLGCDISTEEGRSFAKEHRLFGEFCPEMVARAAAITERLLNE